MPDGKSLSTAEIKAAATTNFPITRTQKTRLGGFYSLMVQRLILVSRNQLPVFDHLLLADAAVLSLDLFVVRLRSPITMECGADRLHIREHHARALFCSHRGSRRCREAQGVMALRPAPALERQMHDTRQNGDWNGAMASGQIMPRSSWFCSMAAYDAYPDAVAAMVSTWLRPSSPCTVAFIANTWCRAGRWPHFDAAFDQQRALTVGLASPSTTLRMSATCSGSRSAPG